MRTWYAIQKADEASDSAEISIYDEIGVWGVTAKTFIGDLKAIKAKQITLSINSPGGSVFDAVAIYNALRNEAKAGKTITVRVMGIAASAASLIAMAGDKIVMPENAMMMVHNPLTFAYGNAEELREYADILDKIGASLVATYVARTGKSEEEIKALLADDTYLSAAEAKDLGFADEVEPALAIKASFEVDRLPEQLRAVFAKADEGMAKAEGETDEPGADPNTDPDPEPAADDVVIEAVADQIKALAEKNGLSEFAAHFSLTCKSVDDVATVLARAREIKSLCAVADRADKAGAYIKSTKSVDEIRAELIDALAEEDQHIENTPKEKGTATTNAQPGAVTTQALWAAHRNQR